MYLTLPRAADHDSDLAYNGAMRREVERLFRQADRDIENARKNLTIEAYEVSAFLAQQAVEKYLKGMWVLLKKEPAPHTHSLTELGDGVGVPPGLRRRLADLTPDYTVSRYPNAANAVPYELYDEATGQAKVTEAEEVIRWLRNKIPK
jgi:HEPN domain-containing protein